MLWDNFNCEVKSFIKFIMVSTVTSNKLLRLIGHVHMGDSFTRLCFLWAVIAIPLNFDTPGLQSMRIYRTLLVQNLIFKSQSCLMSKTIAFRFLVINKKKKNLFNYSLFWSRAL